MTSPIEGPYEESDDYNKWYVESAMTLTLDVLIGERDFLGKGIAHRMIKQFILSQYAQADYFLIDPESANTRAMHVYEKVGFKKVEEFHPGFNPKLHSMMRLSVDDLKDEL